MKTPIILVAGLAALFLATAANAQYSQPMRDVENPGRTPFQSVAELNVAGSSQSGVGVTLLPTGASSTVPAGKRAVYDGIYVFCDAPGVKFVQFYPRQSGTKPTVYVSLDANGIGNVNMRVYGDAGDTPGLSVNNTAVGVAHCTVTITGHYITLP